MDGATQLSQTCRYSNFSFFWLLQGFPVLKVTGCTHLQLQACLSTEGKEGTFSLYWLCVSSDFISSVLPGCSSCVQDGEPSPESGSGNLQSSRQTRATVQAPLATFDPQQTADPLVPLVPYASPRSTGQGERDAASVGVGVFVSGE